MKVNDVTTKIEKSGEFKESTFRIKESAKAFDILSSRLYEDVPLAIVRELSTNAYDAHIVAGCKEKPFEVQLPTVRQPVLRIRDFGTGMSQDTIQNLYTTYFDSDKTDSNEVTGCLGLGSKSPFAYCDSFIVTSWHEGIKSVYTMYKNEQRLPTVALAASTPSEEPAGLEVKLAIRSSDIKLFEAAARKALRFFPVLPKISGVPIENVDTETLLGADGWKIVEEVDWNNTNRANINIPIAVMGNIGYEIQTSPLEPLDKESKALLNLPLRLYFGIGEIDMSASREGLHYSERTKKAIQDKLSSILKNLRKIVKEKLAKATTEWEARCTLAELDGKNAIPPFDSLCHVMSFNNVPWKDKKLSSGDIALPADLAPKTSIISVGWKRGRCVDWHTSEYQIKAKVEHNVENIVPNHQVKLVLNDISRGALARTKRWLKAQIGDKDKATKEEYPKLPSAYIITAEDINVYAELQKFLDLPAGKVVRASSLQKIERAKGDYSGQRLSRKNIRAFELKEHPHSYTKSSNWIPVVITRSNPVQYVLLSYFMVSKDTKDYPSYTGYFSLSDPRTFGALISAYNGLVSSDKEKVIKKVYGVPAARASSLPSNWTSVFSFMKANLQSASMSQTKLNQAVFETIATKYEVDPSRYVCLAEALGESCPVELKTMRDELEPKISSALHSSKSAIASNKPDPVKLLGSPADDKAVSKEVKKLIELESALRSKYKLLALVLDGLHSKAFLYNSNGTPSEVLLGTIEYVKMINNQNKSE